MVVRTVFMLLYVALFAMLGFVYGRLPKPTPLRVHQLVGLSLYPAALPVSHMAWSFRVAATCATFVAVGVAWYFGARERKRDGFGPFAHPPFPEGHKPTFGERARRLFTPMRWMLGFVAFFTWFLLFMGEVGTPSERRAREHPECVEAHDASR